MATVIKKEKKKSIPKVVKDLCWNKWVGEDVARTKCMCCGTNEIKMSSFHCGHVIAEANGGKLSIDNLRPICAACNLSMGTENLDDFQNRCGFSRNASVPLVKTPVETKQDKLNKLLISGSLTQCPGTEKIYEAFGSLFPRSPCASICSVKFLSHCNRCNYHYHNPFHRKRCPCEEL